MKIPAEARHLGHPRDQSYDHIAGWEVGLPRLSALHRRFMQGIEGPLIGRRVRPRVSGSGARRDVAEHILVDPWTGQPSGLIDFDWASVGGPALDFVGLLTALGPQFTHQLISAYGTVSWSRLLFYWWLNLC